MYRDMFISGAAVYQRAFYLTLVCGRRPGTVVGGVKCERRDKRNVTMSIQITNGAMTTAGLGHPRPLGGARGPVGRQDVQRRFVGARQMWQVYYSSVR